MIDSAESAQDRALNPALRSMTCFRCGRDHSVEELVGVCRTCGGSLRADYQLGDGTARPGRDGLESLWRYEDVLPISAERAVTLGEGWTPLTQVEDHVWIKDEAQNPTGSFKDRGLSVAVSMARILGTKRLVAPSAGNAAESLAAYGAAAGLPVLVAMPDDTPGSFIEACLALGADVELVAGTIGDAARWLATHRPADAFDVSTLREPYRVEGKKTMAYELYEQFSGDLPEVVMYPTGGGTGLIGMWKAFEEMQRLGWITSPPKLVSVQSAGCAPVVKALHAGRSETQPWVNPVTAAHGLRVPAPFGGYLCLRALRATDGTAVAVPEVRLNEAAGELAAGIGIDFCPEGGAAWAGYEKLVGDGWISTSDRVVVFNTGAGRKYRRPQSSPKEVGR